jgi:hypothetical protein
VVIINGSATTYTHTGAVQPITIPG